MYIVPSRYNIVVETLCSPFNHVFRSVSVCIQFLYSIYKFLFCILFKCQKFYIILFAIDIVVGGAKYCSTSTWLARALRHIAPPRIPIPGRKLYILYIVKNISKIIYLLLSIYLYLLLFFHCVHRHFLIYFVLYSI